MPMYKETQRKLQIYHPEGIGQNQGPALYAVCITKKKTALSKKWQINMQSTAHICIHERENEYVANSVWVCL